MIEKIKQFIEKECDYEWDSETEKEIQKAINHWISCYNEGVHYSDKYITKNIKCDLWRDILTSVFDIHNQMIIDKLNKLDMENGAK